MYLYGSGVFVAGIACSTVSKQPDLCPRVHVFLQRFGCVDNADARKFYYHPDALEEIPQ
jgi:hypothetical protein